MNGDQLSALVRDLADTQAHSFGYCFNLEISAACARWAQVDPEAALKFVLANKQWSFRSVAIGSIFVALAKSDPELARGKVASIAEPELRRQAQACLLDTLAVTSPDEWVAALKANPEEAHRCDASGHAAEWAMADPVAAVKRVMQLPVESRKYSILAVARVWGGKDGAAATAWAQSLKDPLQRNEVLAQIACGMAANDPDAAIGSLASLSGTARRTGFTLIFGTLADVDFDTALAKASALTEPADRNAVLAMFANSTASSSPEHLAAVLEKLPSGSLRNQVLDSLGSRLGGYSTDEVEKILAEYPPKDREKLHERMLEKLPNWDPQRALELYETLPQEERNRVDASSIYRFLAEQDPQALLARVATGPAKEQVEAVGYAFAQMGSHDPQAAVRHLDDFPAGAVRDAAISHMAKSWAEADPAAAFAWAVTIGDVPNRVSALDGVVRQWSSNDPDKARAAVNQPELTSEERDRLLKQFKQQEER